MNSENNNLPQTGLNGLKENWKIDIVSGFLVFLIALPLSLAIAKASGFPVGMGVVTAIVGGIMASFFKVAELSIKGPAAGLITVCSAAVIEFGGGTTGWQITCGVIVVMAIFQVFFGILRLGSFADFFPHSVIHGMLAAIGLIIIAKQIPVLLGDDPVYYKGESPLELFMDIPEFISHAHWHIAVTGIVGLIIMFGLPMLKVKFMKKIPAPMIVLLITIPISIYWHFEDTEPAYSLVTIGDFWSEITFNADFSVIGTFVFWKYVLMFLFICSLESLLTVKAVDNLDPFHRKADPSSDLKAQGASNAVAGMLGGLPMISEVVRSSANIGFGARTKWSNFFHGVFLLIAMISMIPVIEKIPNASLATMLIYAGYRLAAPREFFDTYKMGLGQLIIFLTTIFFTLFEDLIIGVAAGIIVKIIIHLINGVKAKHIFHAVFTIESENNKKIFKVSGSAIFSNLIIFRNSLDKIPVSEEIVLDLSETTLIDHSFMEFMYHYKHDFEYKGGRFSIVGLENHKSLSKHHMAARKLK